MSHHQAPTHTKKRIKGIVAIAAGTALLLGGAGTYAMWSSAEALEAGPVETGDLSLTLGAGTWTLDGLLTPVTAVADPSAVRIVPGDVLTLTQAVDLTLVGDTIAADLSVDAEDLVPAALAPYISVGFTSTTLGTPSGPNTFRVTPANAGTVSTVVTVDFDASTPDRTATATTVDLTAITFALEQAGS